MGFYYKILSDNIFNGHTLKYPNNTNLKLHLVNPITKNTKLKIREIAN